MTRITPLSTPRAALGVLLFVVLSALANPAAAVLQNISWAGGCTHDIECDDGMPCTSDHCDLPPNGPVGTGVCEHAPVPDGQAGEVDWPECAAKFGLLCGGCDDGVFCNGAETCQGGACAAGVPPCSGNQVCSETFNLCQTQSCGSPADCSNPTVVGAEFADIAALRCNGTETCVTGVCVAASNPCGAGALCAERKCSVGAQNTSCITDEDCAVVGGTCSNFGPICSIGRCCTGATEPTCTKRLKRGTCGGLVPGTQGGAACMTVADCAGRFCVGGSNDDNPCTGGGDCPGGACPAASGACGGGGQSCDGVGGVFYPGDEGLLPFGELNCPVLNDLQVRCPKYGSGIAPYGAVLGYAGAVSNSQIINSTTGTPINKLGDDYRFTNTGVCVGGNRDGLGCAGNSGCPNGGVCNLAGPSVMSVYYVRLLGGFFLPSTRVVVEFHDALGRFVAEAYPEMATLWGLERLFFDPPMIVPSEGFVVLRIASEYTPNGEFVWASTEAVDVGSNDPDVLWVNDGPVANFLAPNPGILAFELEGEKVAAPLGACCDSAGVGCTDGMLPWVCEGDGNTFQGVGTTCPEPACDTGACCNPSTGDCTVDTETNCTAGSGEFQGYGTDCDADHGYDGAVQHCCTQPVTGGADRCQDAAVHMITVPQPGQPPTVVTITGDNNPAIHQAEDFCCPYNAECPIDFGWWEAFEIDKEAFLRIDFCCSDPEHRRFYQNLYDSCPCGQEIPGAQNPYHFPEAQWGWGEPYCADGNPWTNFGPLPAGRYYYRVQSTSSSTHGPYQMHITVDPIALAACCVADQCSDGVTQLECDAMGGIFLSVPQKFPAVTDCSGDPCATGSCCFGPGQCTDAVAGQPMTQTNCTSQGGTYTGGVRCYGGTCSNDASRSCQMGTQCAGNANCLGMAQQLAQPNPCPICEIEGLGNCQPFDNSSLNFTLSDRHLGFNGQLAADDFIPEGGTLSHVCVWGFFLDTDPNAAELDCESAVGDDHFRVRVFANDPATGRSPGALIGTSMATSQRGIVPGTLIRSRLEISVYGFELELESPIAGLGAENVYWLEVSNDVSDSSPSCNWLWMQRQQDQNSYSFYGHEHEYPEQNAAPFDNVFCLNMRFLPLAGGTLTGACCTCDGNCSLKTLNNCDSANGVWDISATTCAGVSCPAGPPSNDNCIDGPTMISAGSHVVSNQCATTDGFGPVPADWDPVEAWIDFDLWYTFVALTTCDLVVSECQTGRRFDSMFAVYMNCPPGAPANCDKTICPPCALEEDPNGQSVAQATLAGLGQDESCTPGEAIGGAGIWRASEQILRDAEPGECFLLRLGSYSGEDRGTAFLDISCGPPCIPSTAPPCEPYFVEFTRFIAIGCGLFHPCANQVSVRGAIRVHLTSLHHVNPPYTGGPSIPFTSFEGQIRWVGPPAQYVESAANPTPFWASSLQCTPHYQDWGAIPIVYVTGPTIVPSSTYDYELVRESCQGIEDTCTDVSPTFTAKTTRWGDVEAPYNPPDASGQPDLGDVAALVNKFRSAPGAPTKVRALLTGVDQFGNMNLAGDFDFSHIAACVDAFRGRPYPHTIPTCP